MRWPRWLCRRADRDAERAERAEREALAKLRQSRAEQREVQRAVDEFTQAVEAALRRRA